MKKPDINKQDINLYILANNIAMTEYGVEIKFLLDRGIKEDEEILNHIVQKAKKLLKLMRKNKDECR